MGTCCAAGRVAHGKEIKLLRASVYPMRASGQAMPGQIRRRRWSPPPAATARLIAIKRSQRRELMDPHDPRRGKINSCTPPFPTACTCPLGHWATQIGLEKPKLPAEAGSGAVPIASVAAPAPAPTLSCTRGRPSATGWWGLGQPCFFPKERLVFAWRHLCEEDKIGFSHGCSRVSH